MANEGVSGVRATCGHGCKPRTLLDDCTCSEGRECRGLPVAKAAQGEPMPAPLLAPSTPGYCLKRTGVSSHKDTSGSSGSSLRGTGFL